MRLRQNNANQSTIARKVSCTGVGLHSGAPARLTLCPAPPGSGIVLVRSDRAAATTVRAHAAAVSSTQFATSLGRGDDRIGTVEHLLAALYGLGIDNLRVELDGPECPVMDGSAASFVYLIRSAGIERQGEPRCLLHVHRPLEVRDGERSIRVEPARRVEVHYAVDFEHPVIRRQELVFEATDPGRFEREIAGARTFGFLRDVEALWNAGFARGGSFENTVLLDDERVLNPGGLRWRDEFVRHKVLDLLGDLALLGAPIQGRIRVERGGHSLHQRLVSALLANPGAWTLSDGGPEMPELRAAAG